MDASVPEMHKEMQKAVAYEPAEKTANVDDNVVRRVLTLLQARLTPQELAAVFQILTAPPSKNQSRFDPGSMRAEDERFAHFAFDSRWPNAAPIGTEPACRVEPQRPKDSAGPPRSRAKPSPPPHSRRF